MTVLCAGLVECGERFVGGEFAALEIGQDRAAARAAVVGSRSFGRGLGGVAQRGDDVVKARADGRIRDAEFALDLADDAAVLDEDLDEIDLRAGELEERRRGELAFDGD